MEIKLKSQFEQPDPRGMWQGLRIIIDYNWSTSTTARADASLSGELNAFYTQSEVNPVNSSQRNTLATVKAPIDHKIALITVLMSSKTCKESSRVKCREAGGPDAIPG